MEDSYGGLENDVLIGNTSEVPCFKIVLVGDPEVGKSSIFLRYFKNQFDYSYRPTTTVTIENVVKKLNVPEHTIASISIWDLPGREEIDLRQSYYKDVDAAIVVVDASDPESVDLAGTWRQDILNHAVVSTKQVVQTPEGPRIVTRYEKAESATIPVLLLGNKFDIVEDKLALLNPPNGGESEMMETEANGDGRENMEVNKSEEPLADSRMDVELDGTVISNQSGAGTPWESGERDEGDREDRGDHRQLSRGGKEGEIWKYEEEQVKDEKPAEILHLEACSEQHGFVGSVAVSAKEPNGGVHVSIQALVRHLLEHRLRHKALQKMAAVQVKRSKQRRLKPPKTHPDAFQPLEATGIPELDEEFARFNAPLSLVHEASLAYQRALKRFKQLCILLGYVGGLKCSIEDCIEGIKRALVRDDLELVTQERDGFIELVVKGDERDEDDKNAEMRELLTAFNTEVSVASSIIVSEFAVVEEKLGELSDSLMKSSPGLINQYVQSQGNSPTPQGQQRVKEVTGLNLAKVKHTRIQCTERARDVESLQQKINATMMW